MFRQTKPLSTHSFKAVLGGMGYGRPGGGNIMQDVRLPYILALPGVLVDFVHTVKGGQCRPHELLLETGRLVGAYALPADDWGLVKQWCMVAAQAKTDGDSHLALKIQPAFSADKNFLDWCERRIDTTMGLRVREIIGGAGMGRTGSVDEKDGKRNALYGQPHGCRVATGHQCIGYAWGREWGR